MKALFLKNRTKKELQKMGEYLGFKHVNIPIGALLYKLQNYSYNQLKTALNT